jgi:hypothetical protein
MILREIESSSKIHMAIPDGFEFLHPEIDNEKRSLL